MIEVTVDVFSGRPNPSWIIDNETEAREILKELALNRAVVADIHTGFQGLGFRGVVIEMLADDITARYDLPSFFRIAGGATGHEAKAAEIAERLINGMVSYPSRSPFTDAPVPFDAALQTVLLDELRAVPLIEDQTEGDFPDKSATILAAAPTCYYEVGRFNPGFWNDPAHIGRNNCYNYATNRRTNTFAQPGRASGHQYTALTCAEVTRGALSDGAHHRFDCFPDTEKPRWLMAMVVGPGYDYHWYRKQQEGFWGHKPGGTAARNVDNNGHVITNPETCARGRYTDFCGYFYAARSMRVN
jgi:hypothetical protein